MISLAHELFMSEHYPRNLKLADHVVRITLLKEHSKAVISGILWAYDSPNEVSSNTGLQQSRRCTCDTANFR